MSLVPYTITALERDVADADASGKQIIVGATCSMFIQPANTAALLYDDAAGSNGSTAKVTNASGQVVVFVEAGTYIVSVNGVAGTRVDVDQLRADLTDKSFTPWRADYFESVSDMINSTTDLDDGYIVTTKAFHSGGVNGGANYNVVLTSSVTPDDYSIIQSINFL